MRIYYITSFVLGVLCYSLPTYGQQLPANPPPEWSIYLDTGGAPWEVQFKVVIGHEGSIRIEKRDKGAADYKIAHEGTLEEALLNEIYSHTVSALRSFRLRESPSDLVDGSSVRLSLSVYGSSIQIHISELRDAPAAGENVAAMLELINGSIPNDVKVW